MASFELALHQGAGATDSYGFTESVEFQRMNSQSDIVLVVDDDLAVRESLKFALELEGLVVHACGSGMELLRHPDLSRARCLVLDYRMPVIDGFEVIEHLSALQVALPVILITSAATDALRERASKAGVRYVVEKPLSDSALLENIHDVLRLPSQAITDPRPSST
jgi:two-component system response regulator FixJ